MTNMPVNPSHPTEPSLVAARISSTVSEGPLPIHDDDHDNDDDNIPDQDETRSKPGLLLHWSRLVKTVQVKEANGGLIRSSIAAPIARATSEKGRDSTTASLAPPTANTTKVILNGVSGYAEPSKVLCMMGPSGSGKTSLLNVISGRTAHDSGRITINGKLLSENASSMRKRIKAQIAYVKQADIFFNHLTVRDQLGYTAFLRLPQTWVRDRKLEEVERIMKLLRLTKVADSMISTLSGGEKKRVNIGTELLTDPSCLLLDEPTSGLDSTSAVALIQMLQQLARDQNKTVITSIHQPSSALFFSFDKLIMLAEGNVVYFGSPRDSLNYLRMQMNNLTCPDGYNVADHWMDLLVQDTAIDPSSLSILLTSSKRGVNKNNTDCEEGNTAAREGTSATGVPSTRGETIEKVPNDLRTMTTRDQLIWAWDDDAVADQMDLTTDERDDDDPTKTRGGSTNATSLVEGKYNTSWGYQYRTLVHRSLKNSRSALFTPINLIKSVALGIISGALWFQMEYTEANIVDLSSFFFYTSSYWIFDSMFNSLMAFPEERDVILKERSSASYHLGAYFMAKTTSELPTRLVLPLIYMFFAFWMAGISSRVGVFVSTTVVCLLSVMTGEAIGLLVGASIYDMERAMTVMTVVSLALLLLGGFFVDNVPTWLDWGIFLSPFKYSFDASRLLIFDRPIPCDGSGALKRLCDQQAVDGEVRRWVSSEEVIEELEIQGSVAFNVGILVFMGILPRYLAYLALKSKKEGER